MNQPISKALPRHLRTVLLDRDGVLNEKMPEGRYVSHWEDFHVLPGVPQAIARLNRAGLRTIVVSNQRGIALGLYTAVDVAAIHDRFQQLLRAHEARIDAFFICPHENGRCGCRKPLPGLFEQATAQFPEISPETSVMIGDSALDVEFGRRLGIATILLQAAQPASGAGAANLHTAGADLVCTSLAQAVDAILGEVDADRETCQKNS